MLYPSDQLYDDNLDCIEKRNFSQLQKATTTAQEEASSIQQWLLENNDHYG